MMSKNEGKNETKSVAESPARRVVFLDFSLAFFTRLLPDFYPIKPLAREQFFAHFFLSI